MNEILGVLFQSRLNHNIREVKGWSYGVGSSYAFGRGPGPFRANGDIVTAKSDSALIEFMRELRDIRGSRPPSDDEMEQAKASLVQSLPAAFESVGSVNGSISSIYTQGLPSDYFQQFARAVNAVTKDDVVRVARKYIDPEHLTILIVGDRAKIEGPLAATHIAPIVVLDVNGNPVQTRTTTGHPPRAPRVEDDRARRCCPKHKCSLLRTPRDHSRMLLPTYPPHLRVSSFTR
jgi:hypothetical protein